MANICSVGLHLEFRYKKDKKAFCSAFQKKIDTAESRNEGVKIAGNKWLFDANINEDGDKGLVINGCVRWCLEQEAMAEFHKYLKKMKVAEYNCCYEETSCQVYGEYTYDGDEIWDCYVGTDNPVWHKANTGEDDYFDEMDYALETDGVLEQVA